MNLLYARLAFVLVVSVLIILLIVFGIRKSGFNIKLICFFFSGLLVVVLVLCFSNIYVFDLKSNDTVAVAKRLNNTLESMSFNEALNTCYETSFEDDENMYWISCYPYDKEYFDKFVSDELLYSLSREFCFEYWNIYISPTIYYFDASYLIGYHEKPTRRILCYNENIVIELQYSSNEYIDNSWADVDFDLILQQIM